MWCPRDQGGKEPRGVGREAPFKAERFRPRRLGGLSAETCVCLPQSAFRDARSHFFSGSWDRLRHCTTLSLTTHCTAGLAAVLQQLPSAERARQSLFSCWQLLAVWLLSLGTRQRASCAMYPPGNGSAVFSISGIGCRHCVACRVSAALAAQLSRYRCVAVTRPKVFLSLLHRAFHLKSASNRFHSMASGNFGNWFFLESRGSRVTMMAGLDRVSTLDASRACLKILY